MISRDQIALNVIGAYIGDVKQRFPAGHYYSEKYQLILKIRQWQLRRKVRGIPLELSQLATLKTGVRNAEDFLYRIQGGSPRSVAQEIADILASIILELTKEIVVNEELYPKLKLAFDRERAEYRAMRGAALEADKIVQ